MFSFLILMSIACLVSPIISTRKEQCESINCECFQDLGGLEYHCPSADWHRKLVIQKLGDQKLIWQCISVDDMDKYVPNLNLTAKEMNIINCPLTAEAAINIDFKNIEEMRIINCTLKSGFVEVLANFSTPRMKILSLRSVTFDENVDFENFDDPNLKHLELKGVDIRFGKKIFEKQPNLKTLDLRSNNIKILEGSTFENLFELESLDLAKNDLVSLNSETLEGLFGLVNLFLEKNKLEYLERGSFRDLKKLATLDLSQNSICFLHKNVLKPLKSLREINLNSNEGIELDDYVFSNFSELRNIEMGFSNLRNIPENTFRGSTKIMRIDLEKNSISSIPSSLFDGLSNLITLNIKNNEIQTIDSTAFNSLSGLTKLDLSWNRIERLNSELLQPLVKLQHIDLSSNKINFIDDHCFSKNENLREIYLSRNKYKFSVNSKTIPKNSPFAECFNLETLDLGFNLIQNIPGDLLDSARELKSVILRGNKIKSLDLTSVWKIAYKGIMLNLEENEIAKFIFDQSTLPEEPEDPENVQASYVFLSQNPLNCDCDAYAFMNFINNVMGRSAEWGILFVFKDLACASPPKMKGIEYPQIFRYISGCN